VDQVNHRAQKAWKALHFVTRVLKKGDRNTKSLACTSLVRPILEYGSACWDPCRGQINALDRVQQKAAQFTNRPTAKPWLGVGRQHAYAHFLKRILGNRLGKLYATGCVGLTV